MPIIIRVTIEDGKAVCRAGNDVIRAITVGPANPTQEATLALFAENVRFAPWGPEFDDRGQRLTFLTALCPGRSRNNGWFDIVKDVASQGREANFRKRILVDRTRLPENLTAEDQRTGFSPLAQVISH